MHTGQGVLKVLCSTVYCGPLETLFRGHRVPKYNWSSWQARALARPPPRMSASVLALLSGDPVAVVLQKRWLFTPAADDRTEEPSQ